ncbi:hypothetical protein ABZV65_12125 [Streptomyces bauhiniae]|uniref:hypothetical protein n=2 Tax=Streptomyces bauhiniae TaxID=2340725 RepID=UPI0033B90882
MYSPPHDPAAETAMRAHHLRAARALGVELEPGSEFWGWAGRTLGAPARTDTGRAVWLRLTSAPVGKATGKLWDGAATAELALGDLGGRRPALLGLHDTTEGGTAYRAELSARIGAPVLSATPDPQQDLDLPDTWWSDLTDTLDLLAATPTDRIAVRTQYMERAVPRFVGIPAPAAPYWTTAHADLHWANLTATPLQILDWEGWGSAPAGFDAAMLYAYSLGRPAVATRVRTAFPVLGSRGALAAEATVCASLLQSVDRGDNPDLAGPLSTWASELRSRTPDRPLVEPSSS